MRGSRWKQALLIGGDLASWFAAYAILTAMRYADVSEPPWGGAAITAAITAFAFVAWCGLLRLYSQRHAVGSLDEAVTLATVGGLITLASTALVAVLAERPLSVSIPLGAGAMAVLGSVAVRAGFRMVSERRRRAVGGKPVIIVGAGDAGTRLARDMLHEPDRPYNPLCFVDDDPRRKHYRVGPVRVRGTVSDLPRLIDLHRPKAVLLAAPSAGPDLLQRVDAVARPLGVRTKTLPTLAQLVNHQVGFRDLRDLELSDFLGRSQVPTELTSPYLTGRRVLVTGAGGSIGSELCRQIHRMGPAALMMLDRDESALHALQLSLDGRGQLNSRDLILADIRDAEAISELFTERRPDVVFHAAALKHLSMLQMYPDEALKTNVRGTLNVLTAAAKADVETFVNISTDKAADPISVLGQSKRVAEHLTAAFTGQGRYVSVRFGNVLGSRGSVLTAFAEQIRAGGPVTVTHREVTRYFMTVSEAVHLVLQAGAIGAPGEVLVLDMGEPVRIMDVARQMIELANSEAQIVVTQLRPGEKLHEVLRSDNEDLLPSDHPKVWRTAVAAADLAWLDRLRQDQHLTMAACASEMLDVPVPELQSAH